MVASKTIARKINRHGSESSIISTSEEIADLNRLAKLLAQVSITASEPDGGNRSNTLSVAFGGEQAAIPVSVVAGMRELVQKLIREGGVRIISTNEFISTIDAARILNVSRPYLVKLLSQGEIPFHMVGTHRRVPYNSLIEYKRRRDAEQHASLERLAGMNEELDFSLEEIEQFNKDRRPGRK